jgi:hypothetical protein
VKDSDNPFIHALFYILKDIRDVKGSSSVSQWIDPDAKAFSEIRNAMEHRSFKVVDDFGYELVGSHNKYHEAELDELIKEMDEIRGQLCLSHDPHELSSLKAKLSELESKLYEKKKLSSHSLLIPMGQFESRIMTLIKLVRNSIIYLSLSIHFEEKKRPDDKIYLPVAVPLKN